MCCRDRQPTRSRRLGVRLLLWRARGAVSCRAGVAPVPGRRVALPSRGAIRSPGFQGVGECCFVPFRVRLTEYSSGPAAQAAEFVVSRRGVRDVTWYLTIRWTPHTRSLRRPCRWLTSSPRCLSCADRPGRVPGLAVSALGVGNRGRDRPGWQLRRRWADAAAGQRGRVALHVLRRSLMVRCPGRSYSQLPWLDGVRGPGRAAGVAHRRAPRL